LSVEVSPDVHSGLSAALLALYKQGLPPPHPRPRLRDAPEVLERVVVIPPDGTQMLSALLRPSLQVHIDIAM
jgi:hypothetical protein